MPNIRSCRFFVVDQLVTRSWKPQDLKRCLAERFGNFWILLEDCEFVESICIHLMYIHLMYTLCIPYCIHI